MTTATRVLLFHRDLRLHDHPALAAAAHAGNPVVPLFVVDPRIDAGPHRRRYLAGALADLRASLRRIGADLLIRRGDPVAEAIRLAAATGAHGIHATADASGYAVARQRRLAEECRRHRLALRLHPGVTVVPPGELKPGGGDHYRVFTPYWRAWQQTRWRAESPAPGRLRLPDGPTGDDPATVLDELAGPGRQLHPAGESDALRDLTAWLARLPGYPETHDGLADGDTSRLSAHLHFGALSPRHAAARCAAVPEFVRQLCWRDFYHQVLAGFPELPRRAYRRGAAESWDEQPEPLAAWQQGHTGVPIVDAGMRQLAADGFLPNRTRLITASYLTRTLNLDWRAGAAWYDRLLVDADLANNYGNWQWVAGTGNDARPYRRFNPLRQAHRFDPDGDYVRRWVPELAGIDGGAVHQPWQLPEPQRRRIDYPEPIRLPATAA